MSRRFVPLSRTSYENSCLPLLLSDSGISDYSPAKSATLSEPSAVNSESKGGGMEQLKYHLGWKIWKMMDKSNRDKKAALVEAERKINLLQRANLKYSVLLKLYIEVSVPFVSPTIMLLICRHYFLPTGP